MSIKLFSFNISLKNLGAFPKLIFLQLFSFFILLLILTLFLCNFNCFSISSIHSSSLLSIGIGVSISSIFKFLSLTATHTLASAFAPLFKTYNPYTFTISLSICNNNPLTCYNIILTAISYYIYSKNKGLFNLYKHTKSMVIP